MVSHPSRPLLAVGALLALLALGASAAPPPQSVCSPCHDGLETEAHWHDVSLHVTHSEATVRLFDNGSGYWTVTARVRTGDSPVQPAQHDDYRNPDVLGSDDDLRAEIVGEAVDRSFDYLEPDRRDAIVRSHSYGNRTLRFSFLEPDMAARAPLGGVRFDEFHTRGRGSGWYVDVDRLTVIGPPGTTVASDPAGVIGSDIASVDGRRLVLRGVTADERDYANAAGEDPPTFDREDVFVVFAPPGDFAGVVGTLAVLAVTVPELLSAALVLVGPGLLVLSLTLAGLYVTRFRTRGTRRTALAWAALSLGAYLVPAILFVPGLTPLTGLAVVYAVVPFGYALVVAGVSSVSFSFVRRWLAN